MPVENKSNKSDGDSKFRITLATTVTTWALVAILAIAGLIIVVAGINAIRAPSEKTGEFFDIAKYILRCTSACNRSLGRYCPRFLFRTGELRGCLKKRCQSRTSALAARKAPSGTCGPAMMKIGDVTVFKMPADKTEADITIKQLIDDGFEKDKSRPRNRLPILDADGRGKYVLHRSTVDAFLAAKKNPPTADESTLTLKDLLEDPKLKDYIVNSFMPLSEDATLADAKDLFDKNTLCLDLLITQDGTKNGIVVGWITNVMVLQAATI